MEILLKNGVDSANLVEYQSAIQLQFNECDSLVLDIKNIRTIRNLVVMLASLPDDVEYRYDGPARYFDDKDMCWVDVPGYRTREFDYGYYDYDYDDCKSWMKEGEGVVIFSEGADQFVISPRIDTRIDEFSPECRPVTTRSEWAKKALKLVKDGGFLALKEAMKDDNYLVD